MRRQNQIGGSGWQPKPASSALLNLYRVHADAVTKQARITNGRLAPVPFCAELNARYVVKQEAAHYNFL